MKQFSQCTNCQQWYVCAFTTAIELYQDDRLRQVTVWCLRCIDEAEQRSQPTWLGEAAAPELHLQSPELTSSQHPEEVPGEDYQHFIQEHTDLMGRALREDDAVLVPVVEDFLQRCLSFQHQVDIPEQANRISGNVQYWKAFLKALNQSL
ncbi:MAG: hypothetical protein O7G88_22615 [bacterium]|nr:hypothetical protein [bacterium]